MGGSYACSYPRDCCPCRCFVPFVSVRQVDDDLGCDPYPESYAEPYAESYPEPYANSQRESIAYPKSLA